MQLAKIGLERWHVCPYPGGLFDQPYELLLDVLRLNSLESDIRAEGEFVPDEPVSLGDDETAYVRL